MPRFSQKGFAHLGFIAVLLIAIGVGTYLVQQRTNILPSAQEQSLNPVSNNQTPGGWDYNLTHRCIKSVYPNEENYYQDLADCPNPKKNWTIAVESEKELLGSCPGPLVQSFPVNKAGSPVSLNWISHTDELGRRNWTVNLKTDMSNFKHPCGPGYFTWVALMDHLYLGGGPFPKPNDLKFSADVYYDESLISGAGRAMVGWQGVWDDTDDGVASQTAKEIELNFYISPNWGDGHPDEDIIVMFKNRDGKGTDYIAMDGKPLNITVPKGVSSKVEIDFSKIINDLVSRGLFKPPAGGWNEAKTTAMYISTEFKNETEANSGVANLYVTNFRPESISSPIVSPNPSSSLAPPASCRPLPQCVAGKTCEMMPSGDGWCPLPSATPTPSSNPGDQDCASDSECSSGQSCQQICTASFPAVCKSVCMSQPLSNNPQPGAGQTGGAQTQVSKIGDLDNDGDVDIYDINEFTRLFRAGNIKADLNNDGKVSIFDFNVLLSNFRK